MDGIVYTPPGHEHAAVIDKRSRATSPATVFRIGRQSCHQHSHADKRLGYRTFLPPQLPWLERMSLTETLRRKLANAQGESEGNIDLIDMIDLAEANLTMRAIVAGEGIPLTGENSTAWARFLRRIWRELEDDHYWETTHAA
jgi:hypothetical protein